MQKSTGRPAREIKPAPSATCPAPGDINNILNRLDRWLAAHRQRYRNGLQPGASPAELETLQESLGCPLPAELRSLLAWHNGQSADFSGHFEQDWDLMNAVAIASAKRDLDGEVGAHCGLAEDLDSLSPG